MESFNQLEVMGLEITHILLPWISVLISIVFVFWFKDFATSLAKGLKFRNNPLFNEGDKVLLEDQDAILDLSVKMLCLTGSKTWTSVYNPLSFLTLFFLIHPKL